MAQAEARMEMYAAAHMGGDEDEEEGGGRGGRGSGRQEPPPELPPYAEFQRRFTARLTELDGALLTAMGVAEGDVVNSLKFYGRSDGGVQAAEKAILASNPLTLPPAATVVRANKTFLALQSKMVRAGLAQITEQLLTSGGIMPGTQLWQHTVSTTFKRILMSGQVRAQIQAQMGEALGWSPIQVRMLDLYTREAAGAKQEVATELQRLTTGFAKRGEALLQAALSGDLTKLEEPAPALTAGPSGGSGGSAAAGGEGAPEPAGGE
jgi:hypothetical protein